jgi:hypothetical protein
MNKTRHIAGDWAIYKKGFPAQPAKQIEGNGRGLSRLASE